jgi:hypothetical protein
VDSGSVRLPAITHQLLSEYIGSSRELVTWHLGSLRRMGQVRYTRLYIDIHRKTLETLYSEPLRHGFQYAQARSYV